MSHAAKIIANEITKDGAIPFARFMQLALYCPVCGYYEKEEDTIGRVGDYYTSVSVGPLFGDLLAFQFAEWLEEERWPMGGNQQPEVKQEVAALQILEAGAHNAQLARDILAWLGERRPGLFQRLQYWIVEPSPRRQQWQKRTLGELADKVRWVRTLADLRASPPGHASSATPHTGGIRQIIFANELLDAMPVHRLGWDANSRVWFEWGVALQEDRFVWTRLPNHPSTGLPDALLPTLDPQLSAVLPDGFVVELCPAAAAWWRSAASVMRCGKLLTFDYGQTADQFLTPERKAGTLRSYRCHRPSHDVLAQPSEQDITADVDFTAIQAAGEAGGLETEDFLTQSQFLTRIAAQTWKSEGSFGKWTAERTRQFQTLTHPELMGRSFRVLVQGRY